MIMRILIIFLLFLSVNGVNSQTLSNFDPFALKAEYFEKPEIKDGLTFQEGEVKYKIVNTNYVRGIKIVEQGNEKWHGVVFHLHSSGKVSSITVYHNGLRHGLYESFNQEGKKLFVTPYSMGEKHGISKQYNEAGWLYCEEEYSYGVVQWKIYYYNPEGGGEKGPISGKSTYRDGKLKESITYYRDGRVYSKQTY